MWFDLHFINVSFFLSTVPSSPPQNLTLEVQNSKVRFYCFVSGVNVCGICCTYTHFQMQHKWLALAPVPANGADVCANTLLHSGTVNTHRVEQICSLQARAPCFAVWLAASEACSLGSLGWCVNAHRSSHRLETGLSEAFILYQNQTWRPTAQIRLDAGASDMTLW